MQQPTAAGPKTVTSNNDVNFETVVPEEGFFADIVRFFGGNPTKTREIPVDPGTVAKSAGVDGQVTGVSIGRESVSVGDASPVSQASTSTVNPKESMQDDFAVAAPEPEPEGLIDYFYAAGGEAANDGAYELYSDAAPDSTAAVLALKAA